MSYFNSIQKVGGIDYSKWDELQKSDDRCDVILVGEDGRMVNLEECSYRLECDEDGRCSFPEGTRAIFEGRTLRRFDLPPEDNK